MASCRAINVTLDELHHELGELASGLDSSQRSSNFVKAYFANNWVTLLSAQLGHSAICADSGVAQLFGKISLNRQYAKHNDKMLMAGVLDSIWLFHGANCSSGL